MCLRVRDIDKSIFVMMVMKKMLCEDTDWLLSEEAFSIYASCMYHPTYNDYVGLMEDYLSDTSKKVFVYEDRGKKTGLMVLKISEDAAEIIGIAVSDNARRKGIGTQLIQRVMDSTENAAFQMRESSLNTLTEQRFDITAFCINRQIDV